MQNLLDDLIKVLSKDERCVVEGQLLKNKVIELALKLDSDLIKRLLSNKAIKKHFFADVDGVLVFDKIKFQQFVSNKEFLPDSYTAFKNKIGLVNENGDLLADSKEVVLAWPYKDCVLEGGQDKEDAKRDEIFWNETLAPDEIDRLLYPKAFTNFKRYDKKGEHKLDKFNRNEKGDIIDNLIIKGNNLLALHSLKKEFAGKIRLIYIDPPYNTDNSGFGYNDSFNHSAWLTFMKNRLEIARQLLTNDGSIYMNIDYNEVHYLKVLMDEVFGRNNFQREIIWRIGWLSGYKTTANNYIRNHDTILYYSNSPDKMVFNKIYNTPEDYSERFNNSDKEEILNYLKKLKVSKKDSQALFDFLLKVGLPDRYPLEDTWNSSNYDKLNSIAIVSYSGEKVSKMLGTEEFKGQKSEKLLKRIIEVSSNIGDIILDFCAGTGTTGAVAHKLGRQYILCEQMEYIDYILKERLNKVIDGEQSGISKNTNWKGGGSFVYCELARHNEEFSGQITKAKTSKELKSIWKDMQEKAFLSYKVDVKTINENIDDFDKLSLADQKRFLLEVLDKNMLYVNYCDIDDKSYRISEYDKEMNRSFYKDK